MLLQSQEPRSLQQQRQRGQKGAGRHTCPAGTQAPSLETGQTKNLDDLSTRIAVADCTYNWPDGNRFGLELHRNDSWTPDENYGAQTFWCSSSTTWEANYWSDKGAGSFYFDVYNINGSTTGFGFASFNAEYVGVRY
ncbi:hypothetical protein GCM10027591_09910 [Zhihengliuella somnathii]